QFDELAAATRAVSTSGTFPNELISVLKDILAAIDDVRKQLARKVKHYFTVDEIADLTGRTPFTVRRWIKEGRITATRVEGNGAKGKLLIARYEIAKLVASGMTTEITDISSDKDMTGVHDPLHGCAE